MNIGVSENKLLTKMASDFQKPDRVHTLWREEIPQKMWPLSVGDLFYVGRATEKTLSRLGIHTIGDLAHAHKGMIKGYLKSHGLTVWNYANGIDESPVVSEPPENKGYGNSLTTPQDVTDPDLAKLYTSNVADNLLQREFESYGPRIVLLTDITYLPYNGRFAYLSTILDAFTKQILSYVLSPSLEVDFVLETVNQLIENHGVSLQAETIIHSDQCCHYTSHKFINILYEKKLRH